MKTGDGRRAGLPSSVFSPLHRIHKRLLHPVEDHRADEDDRQHEAETVEQAAQVHAARAEEGVAEGLHDGRHRVGEDDPLPARRDGRDRVDDRRGVHQQRHAKSDEEAQVAVLGRQRGDDDAEAQSQPGHDEDEQRRERGPQPVDPHVRAAQREEKDERQEQAELDQEGDQVRDQDRDRHGHAREIYLAEQVGVLHEGLAGLGQAGGEVTPHHRPGHIKEELRQAVGGQAGDVAEDDRERDRGQQRLDEIPQRPKDGLLVGRHEIAPHEKRHQVPVTPQFAQAQVEQAALGLDDHIPLFVFDHSLNSEHPPFRQEISFGQEPRRKAASDGVSTLLRRPRCAPAHRLVACLIKKPLVILDSRQGQAVRQNLGVTALDFDSSPVQPASPFEQKSHCAYQSHRTAVLYRKKSVAFPFFLYTDFLALSAKICKIRVIRVRKLKRDFTPRRGRQARSAPCIPAGAAR